MSQIPSKITCFNYPKLFFLTNIEIYCLQFEKRRLNISKGKHFKHFQHFRKTFQRGSSPKTENDIFCSRSCCWEAVNGSHIFEECFKYFVPTIKTSGVQKEHLSPLTIVFGKAKQQNMRHVLLYSTEESKSYSFGEITFFGQLFL